MQRLVWVEKDEREKLEKLFGIIHYNHPPANFREVDEEWVAKKSRYRIYGFKYTWYHQIFIDVDKPQDMRNQPLIGMHFFGDDSSEGIAIYTDYWAGKVRYFAFAGCIHEFRNPTIEECAEHHSWPGNCYHVSICNKCGYWRAIDSSD